MEDDKQVKRTKAASDIMDLALDAMKDQLSPRPVCEACGCKGRVSASDVTNAIKFLKDNGFGVNKEETENFLARITRERKEREAADKAKRPDVQSGTA